MTCNDCEYSFGTFDDEHVRCGKTLEMVRKDSTKCIALDVEVSDVTK